MFVITGLSDKILKIGEKIVETSPVHDIVEDVHSKIVTKKFVGMFARLYNIGLEFKDLKESFGVKYPLKENISSPDYYSHLGLNIIEHDLINKMTDFSFEDILAKTSKFDLNSDKVKDIEFEKNHILAYENVRICLAMIPYVISGDRRFLSDVTFKYVPSLLDNLHNEPEPQCDFTSNRAYISSDEYFCIHQLVKNAKKNLNRKKKDICLSHVPCVQVTAAYEENCSYIAVEDRGTGIEAENLPKIFRGFTDTESGTGIGLQLVKRLFDLRHGRGIVISKVLGNECVGYCMKSGKIKKIALRTRPHKIGRYHPGTYFKLSFFE